MATEEFASLRAWLRRLTAFLFWGTLLHITFEFPFVPPLATSWLIAIALFVLLSALYSFKSVMTAVPYIVTFPLWAPPYLLIAFLRLLRAPWRVFRHVCVRLGRIYRSPITAVVHIVLTIALGFMIYMSASATQLTIATVILLCITLNMVVLTLFMSPSLLISQQMLGLVRRFATRERLLGTVVSRRLRIWPDEEQLEQARSSLDLLVRGKDWLKRFTESLLTPRAVVVSFLVQLLTTFVLVTLSFGFIYYAAARVDRNFFGCSQEAIGVGDATFFSFAVITTSDWAGLCAGSPSSKALIATELICGLLLISVAGLGFSTLYVTDVGSIREELAAVIAYGEGEVEYLGSVIVEAERAAAKGKIPDNKIVVKAAMSSGKTLSEAWAEIIMKAEK